MCFSMVRCWSNVTPRFLHDLEGLMEDWPMVRWIFLLMVDLGEDITRNSVLL